MILPKKHSFVTLSQDMSLFHQSRLAQFGILKFVYIRYYLDGACIVLVNDEELLQHHFRKKYFIPAPPPISLLSQKEAFHIISEEGPFSQAKLDFLQLFNSGQSIDYLVKHEHYYESICFAFSGNNKNALNFIVNNTGQFKNMLEIFKEEMASVLSQADRHRIYLPQEMRGIHFALSNQPDAKSFKYDKQNILTPRQEEVLYWLLKGKTAKEIAFKLNLSPRTIEYHLTSIKIKMNASSLPDLIEKASSNFLLI